MKKGAHREKSVVLDCTALEFMGSFSAAEPASPSSRSRRGQ